MLWITEVHKKAPPTTPTNAPTQTIYGKRMKDFCKTRNFFKN